MPYNRMGLMLTQVKTAAAVTWEGEFAVASAATLRGHTDWRVVNIKGASFVAGRLCGSAFPIDTK